MTVTTGASGFSSGTSNAALNMVFNLSSLTALNNDPSAVFQLVDASTAPYNTATTPFSSGTDRVDNVIVSSAPAPEPASLGLLSIAAAGLLGRRGGRRE